MAVWGGEFSWQNPKDSFVYLKKFANFINQRSKSVFGVQVNAKIATAKEYFDDLKQVDIEFPTYNSDFSPMINENANGNFDYWTGFFGTRPEFKQAIRNVMTRIRSLQTEFVIATAREKEKGARLLLDEVKEFNRVMREIEEYSSLLLDFNVISAAAQPVVIEYYLNLIDKMNKDLDILEQHIDFSFLTRGQKEKEKSQADLVRRVQADRDIITVFNPTPYQRLEIVNVTVPTSTLKLYYADGTPIKRAQVNTHY